MANYNNTKRQQTTPQRSSRPRKSKEEMEAERVRILECQRISLDILNLIAYHLENFLNDSKQYKLNMTTLLQYLVGDKHYTPEQTKIISQHNYLFLDLANAKKNSSISQDRITLRVNYIEERLKTAYRKELHDRIDELMETHNILFYTGE